MTPLDGKVFASRAGDDVTLRYHREPQGPGILLFITNGGNNAGCWLETDEALRLARTVIDALTPPQLVDTPQRGASKL